MAGSAAGGGGGGEYNPEDPRTNPFAGQAPWCSVGAEVVVAATQEVAKVVGGDGSFAQVQLKLGGALKSLRPSELQPVAPAKHHVARAFAGDYNGKQGTMDGVDGEDGILKVMVYGETDFAIVQMCDVVKVAEW
jgi:hypothetical protein